MSVLVVPHCLFVLAARNVPIKYSSAHLSLSETEMALRCCCTFYTSYTGAPVYRSPAGELRVDCCRSDGTLLLYTYTRTVPHRTVPHRCKESTERLKSLRQRVTTRPSDVFGLACLYSAAPKRLENIKDVMSEDVL